MMQSPFSFNFSPQQGQQSQGPSPLQQILSMRQQQGAMPMQGVQSPDMSQGQMPGLPKQAQAPMDFMQLAGKLGYKPDPNSDPLQQQSGAIGHILTKLGLA